MSFRLFAVPRVADVNHVKTALGENDFFALLAIFFHQRRELAIVENNHVTVVHALQEYTACLAWYDLPMHVFLIAATTADGYIAKDAEHLSTRWTSAHDAQFFGDRTKQAKVVVMGAKTFATINRPLPGRLTVVYTKRPETLSGFDPSQVRATTLEPEELVAELEQEGYSELAVCGGTSIYTLFMQAGLIQTLYLTREPVLFGLGMPLFNGPIEVNIELQKIHNLSDQTIVMEYRVRP